MRQHTAVFANFICKFGNLNMADLLAEVVLPAFTDDTLVRDAYGSHFHLLDVEVVESLARDEEEPAIIGQFVRDVRLYREQVYEPGQGLIKNKAFLDSSPSAFFVLLLKDHRLIYYSETEHSPDLKSFQATMDRFILRKYHVYLNSIQLVETNKGNRITKKALKERIEEPSLTIVPITNSEELADFISRFERLQRVDLVVHRKNDEISTSALIANAEAFNETLEGERTRITTTDSKGLSKAGAIEAIEDVGDGANETIKLSGIDANGDRLVGDNEAFSVRATIENVVGAAANKARSLYARFRDLVADGIISRPAANPANVARIKQIVADDGIN